MSDYKESIVIVCVIFDEQCEFHDILLIGIADDIDRARSFLMSDILQVVRDFDSGKCEIEVAKSEYGETITILHTWDKTNNGLTMHRHYYCLFDESEDEQ